MQTWLISDTHFGHKNILKYTRPQFSTIDEHDEFLIESWNSVVRQNDTVWHLGDVLFPRRCFSLLSKLNGDKNLVMGNHDVFGLDEYGLYFKKIKPYKTLANVILSHIPVHENQKGRYIGNIHGHLHDQKLNDGWYLNVSVETINFIPMSLENALSILGV